MLSLILRAAKGRNSVFRCVYLPVAVILRLLLVTVGTAQRLVISELVHVSGLGSCYLYSCRVQGTAVNQRKE